jgi:hypothetical protein
VLSLPSSGKVRERSIRRRIVLDLFLHREPLWSRVSAIRERWNIEPRVEVPQPTRGFEIYTPQSPKPQQVGINGDEGRWRDELTALHDAVVPKEGRLRHYSALGWRGFLSMCVCFDPPDTQLEEFAENLKWGESKISDRDTGYVMYSPPIAFLRDPDQVEATVSALYQGLIEVLCEKYIHPQGITIEEAVNSVIEEDLEDSRRLEQLWREWQDVEERPYIDVQPHHTQRDIESAFRMISAEHEMRPSIGRRKRDELTAVQCAILHDHHNQTYEQVALACGINPDSNDVSKYIADGRRILKDGQLA